MLSKIVFAYLTKESLLSKKVCTSQRDIPGSGMNYQIN